MKARRIALKVVYWVAVLAISLVIVFMLVMLFESLDDSSVDQGGARTSGGLVLPLPGR